MSVLLSTIALLPKILVRRDYIHIFVRFADVISEGKVRVVLSGNIPINQGVTDWIASHQIEFRNDGSYLSFTVEKGQEHTVNELAELIESIVGSGWRAL